MPKLEHLIVPKTGLLSAPLTPPASSNCSKAFPLLDDGFEKLRVLSRATATASASLILCPRWPRSATCRRVCRLLANPQDLHTCQYPFCLATLVPLSMVDHIFDGLPIPGHVPHDLCILKSRFKQPVKTLHARHEDGNSRSLRLWYANDENPDPRQASFPLPNAWLARSLGEWRGIMVVSTVSMSLRSGVLATKKRMQMMCNRITGFGAPCKTIAIVV